ncbi:MAG TPA: AsmA-like C-terminal region-containing protein [Gemmatimonadaceae bacterium]
MKTRTKILLGAGTVIVVLFVLLATLPFLFSDRIAARVKTEVNSALEARVDWHGAGLSLFGDFPNLTLRLDDLSIAGKRLFAGDTLARIHRLGVVLDIGSVLRNYRAGDAIVVRSIELERPVIALKVLEDGSANWDITKKTAPTTQKAPSPFKVSLRKLDISNATISLDDRKSRLFASLVGYRQSLSGDFATDLFTLATRAHGESVTVRFAGIPYLNHVALDLAADVNADMRNKKFTLAKNEIRLNDLRLALTGSAAMRGDDVALDLSFNTPRTDFRHILSLVPAIYMRDFQKLKTAGVLTLSGQVKGDYGDKAFPSFSVNANVANGAFQYPDLPLPARDIALDLKLRNPGGDVDSTMVRLDRFHAAIGGQPIDGALVLRTPISDPDVDLRLTGKLDLANLRKTVKLASVKELTGKIDADVAVRTRMSYVDRKQYDRIAARGNLGVRDLTLKSADLPRDVAVTEASLQISPQRADLRSFSAQIGSSDVQLSGYVENLLPFALRGDPLRGNATFVSQRFNLDEWKSDDSLTIIQVPGNIDFGLQATVGELIYGKLKMTNARGALRVKDKRATLDNFTMNTLGGSIGVSGFYETVDSVRPTFDTQVQLKSVDIPSAFSALTTVQMLAPVAKFARGNVSTDLHLAGALGKDMLPLFNVLDGKGALKTSDLVIQGLPLLGKIADAIKLEQLRNPTLDSLRASVQIKAGRVQVNPFTVRAGRSALQVAGSHGFDQSLQYTLGLRVARADLGAAANQAIASLISRAGRTGLNLQAADTVVLGIKVGGTITSPTVQTNLADLVASTGQSVKQAAQQAVAQQVDSLKEKADSAADEARKKAQAQAEQMIAQAEQQAAAIRAEAQKLADTVRFEANTRADSLVARTTNPIAKAAAQAAANRMKKEASDRADAMIREADKRANDVVAEARKKAAQISPS